MNIKLFWTQQGQILGDCEEGDGVVRVENPVMVHLGPQGIQMMPLMITSEETVAEFPLREILHGGRLYEPQPELRNQYNSNFGSGIQLMTG